MNDWLYLLVIPALLCLVWFWPDSSTRSPLRRSSDPGSHGRRHDSRFHAVSIEPCSHACAAVMAMRGKRYLATEVSSLPVLGCDASRCQCTYKHFADRRTGHDRRHASSAMQEHFHRSDKRHGKDRRKRTAVMQ
jgi:hypothetical protein